MINNKKNSNNNVMQEISNCLSNIKLDCNFNNVFGNLELLINSSEILKVTKLLKDNDKLKFNQLTDITAVDYPNKKKRFEMIYILLSVEFKNRIIIKFFIEEEAIVDSLSSLFPAANWYEREVWDLFGINFKNHPDLRRLLTDYGFIGHPLRKDFPLSGNVEVKYDIKSKKVVYEPLRLTQSFRTFDFESPWEGESKTNND